MKTLASCLLLLIILVINLHAETITLSGIVKNAKTQTPMDSVLVTLINKDNPNDRYSVITNSSGAWSYSFPYNSIENEAYSPASFSVEQNYPNPFNPSTRINFTTSASGTAVISVYNSVAELIDRKSIFVQAGKHSLEWTSKGAAGVLFYSIEFGGTRITKKMIQMDGGGSSGGIGSTVSYGGTAPRKVGKRLSTGYFVTASKLIYMPDTVIVPLVNNSHIDFALSTVHDKAFVIDLHNDVMEKVILGYQLGIRNTEEQSDLPRFKDGGIDAQMFAIWVDPTDSVAHPFYTYSIAMMDSFSSQIAMNADRFAQARTSDEIQQINSSGKLAGIMCVEGGHAIENSMDKLITYYNRGMRYMTITWNNSTAWAVSAKDSRSSTVGLSEFGKQVIRKLDSLGVLIDVAHTGIKTINDILAVTKNPIIDSHAGARTLNNHYRNLYNYQIDSIAARGGVIGVVFYPPFLSSKNSANIDTVIKHIDYLKNRVGVDYIAIGSDFDGIEVTPFGLEDVSKMPDLTAALLRKGYTIPEVKKILGENYLRVFKKVCDKK